MNKKLSNIASLNIFKRQDLASTDMKLTLKMRLAHLVPQMSGLETLTTMPSYKIPFAPNFESSDEPMHSQS